MTKLRIWTAGILFSAFTAGPVEAQLPAAWSYGPQNSGFTGTIGVGTANGTTEVNGNFAAGGAPGSARYSSSAMTYDLFLGYAISGRWRLGAEVQFMPSGTSLNSYAYAGTTGATVYATVAAAFYPIVGVGFWVKTNVGYGEVNYRAPILVNGVPTGGGTVSMSGGGLAAGLGLGYEWRPAGGAFMIAPFANYVSQLSSVTLSGDTQPWSCRAALLQIGVGFGYNP